jgi:hypothetical protein
VPVELGHDAQQLVVAELRQRLGELPVGAQSGEQIGLVAPVGLGAPA